MVLSNPYFQSRGLQVRVLLYLQWTTICVARAGVEQYIFLGLLVFGFSGFLGSSPELEISGFLGLSSELGVSGFVGVRVDFFWVDGWMSEMNK
uniref:Uncharacterized protein n=1 Tax=Salix viminalis TaxID=40686 RepID=A0A6N2NAN8_SALVM